MGVTEATESPAMQVCAPAVSRPGISSEMLARAGVRRVGAAEAHQLCGLEQSGFLVCVWARGRGGVRRVGAAEAHQLCGLEQSGLWLSYRTAEGAAVMDSGRVYGRLRLDKPQGSKKYHQAFGTGVHAYLPPGLSEVTPGGDLTGVEGEFKAQSLT